VNYATAAIVTMYMENKLLKNIQGAFSSVFEQSSFLAQQVWVHRDISWQDLGSRRPYKEHLVLRKIL